MTQYTNIEVAYDIRRLATLGLYETVEFKHYERLAWTETIIDYDTIRIKHWFINVPFQEHGYTRHTLIFYHKPDRDWGIMDLSVHQLGSLHPLPRWFPYDNIE